MKCEKCGLKRNEECVLDRNKEWRLYCGQKRRVRTLFWTEMKSDPNKKSRVREVSEDFDLDRNAESIV